MTAQAAGNEFQSFQGTNGHWGVLRKQRHEAVKFEGFTLSRQDQTTTVFLSPLFLKEQAEAIAQHMNERGPMTLTVLFSSFPEFGGVPVTGVAKNGGVNLDKLVDLFNEEYTAYLGTLSPYALENVCPLDYLAHLGFSEKEQRQALGWWLGLTYPTPTDIRKLRAVFGPEKVLTIFGA